MKRKHNWSVFPEDEMDEIEASIQGRIEDLILNAHLPLVLIRYPDSLLRMAKDGGANLELVRGFPDLGLYHIDKQVTRFIEVKVVKRIADKLGGMESSQVKWWKRAGLRPKLTFGYTMTEQAVMDFANNPTVNEKMDPRTWIRNEWWEEEYERIMNPHWTTSHGPLGA